jgi:hypothetical protein
MIVHAIDVYGGFPDRASAPIALSALPAAPAGAPPNLLQGEHRRVVCFVHAPDGAREWSSVVALCDGVAVPLGHAREPLSQAPLLKPAVFIPPILISDTPGGAHGGLPSARWHPLWLSYTMMCLGFCGMVASLLMVLQMPGTLLRLRFGFGRSRQAGVRCA